MSTLLDIYIYTYILTNIYIYTSPQIEGSLSQNMINSCEYFEPGMDLPIYLYPPWYIVPAIQTYINIYMYIHNIQSTDNYINAFATTFILSIITYKYMHTHKHVLPESAEKPQPGNK